MPTQEELKEHLLNINQVKTNKVMNKKTITKSEVMQVAIEAINANGETTTLEIKNELRARDFYAIQSEVSSLVNELVKDGELKVTGQNGLYRTYELVTGVVTDEEEDDNVKPTSSTANVTTPVTTPTANINHRDGTVGIAKPIPANLTKKGDWEVSSVAISEVLYFLGHLTRDEVRSAYAKLTGSGFANTRSGRLA